MLLDPNDINGILSYGGKYAFGGTTFDRLKNMDRFIIRHQALPGSDYLLSELMRGWSEYSGNRKRVLDISRWNAASLVSRTDGKASVLRKPKITLTLDVTMPGNLRLSWKPQPGFESDFSYTAADFEVRPPYRELGELLFVRKYERNKHMIKEDQGGWWSAMASHLLSATVSAVEEVADDLAATCDVEWLTKFAVTRHENTKHIDSCEVVLAPRYKRGDDDVV